MSTEEVESLMAKAHAVRRQGSKDAAVERYRKVVEIYGQAPETEVDWAVAQALAWIGYLADDCDSALDAYGEVLARFGGSDDPETRGEVDRALFNRGYVLWRAGRYDEAVHAFDEALEAYAARPRTVPHDVWMDSLFHKASALHRLGRLAEAISVCAAAIDRFSQYGDTDSQATLATARVWLAKLIGEQGDVGQAIALLDRFLGENPAPRGDRRRKNVVDALGEKGRFLELLGDSNEALVVYRTALSRFARGESPEIDAMLNWIASRNDVLITDLRLPLSPSPHSSSI